MVKNDSLITYEKAFEGQAAIKKFFIATFLERKIMSTKTTIKRIALVAAAALAIGGFSAVSPANAAVSVTWADTYDTVLGYGVAGGTATAVISLDASKTYTIASSGVGTVLVSETDGAGNGANHTSPVPASGNKIYGPTTWYVTVGSSGGTDTLTITSAVAVCRQSQSHQSLLESQEQLPSRTSHGQLLQQQQSLLRKHSLAW